MIVGLKPYPEYKEAGLPWLGQVPGHWETRVLKRLCSRSALYGANIPASEYVSQGLRFLRTTDITDDGTLRRGGVFVSEATAQGYMLADGDLLVSRSGTIGRSLRYRATVHGPCAYAGYLVRFVPASTVSADYLFQFTKSLAFADFIRVSAVSSTIENVNGDKFANMPVTLPPPFEQAAIVRFLDWANGRLERAIRAKRKVIALLNEQKQAIIHRAVTHGLDPSVPLKPSGIPWLGDIPRHWEVRRLGGAIRLQTGFPFASAGFIQGESGARLLRGTNVTPSGIRWDETVRWQRKHADGLGDFALEVGDIVLGMDRPIIGSGVRAATIREKDTPSLLLQRVARLRPTGILDAKFLLLLLRGRLFRDYIAPIFTGISVPHLSPQQINNFRVPLPSVEEQQAIVSHLEAETSSFEIAATRLEREIELLREYHTRLVADVVTGKLDVREAAAKLPVETESNDSVLDDEAPVAEEIPVDETMETEVEGINA